jgi:hypothetical protein
MLLHDLLWPTTLESFLTETLDRRWLLIRGEDQKLSGLCGWSALDAELGKMRTRSGRVRLTKNGVAVPQQTIMTDAADPYGARLDVDVVERLLGDGATLVVDYVDELFPDLRALADSLERGVCAAVSANLYACCRDEPGLGTHWDDHDVLILQLCGSKHWTVWGPSGPRPLLGERHHGKAPQGDPVWSGTVTQGDVLYLPAGWWHLVRGVNEASLHVTVGLYQVTGCDLVRWLADELRDEPAMREPWPIASSSAAKSAWLLALRDRLGRHFGDDLAPRFSAYVAGKSRHRRRFNCAAAVGVGHRVPVHVGGVTDDRGTPQAAACSSGAPADRSSGPSDGRRAR